MLKHFNNRVADHIAALMGSMWTFWFISLVLIGWMSIQQGIHGPDQYPFPFLLYLGNVCQLLGMLVLQVTQNRQSAKQQEMMVHLQLLVDQIEKEERQELKALPDTV